MYKRKGQAHYLQIIHCSQCDLRKKCKVKNFIFRLSQAALVRPYVLFSKYVYYFKPFIWYIYMKNTAHIVVFKFYRTALLMVLASISDSLHLNTIKESKYYKMILCDTSRGVCCVNSRGLLYCCMILHLLYRY